MDMFVARFEKDLENKEAGRSYRREILAPGGSRDAADSLVAFLGRPPSNTAFLKAKGLLP